MHSKFEQACKVISMHQGAVPFSWLLINASEDVLVIDHAETWREKKPEQN